MFKLPSNFRMLVYVSFVGLVIIWSAQSIGIYGVVFGGDYEGYIHRIVAEGAPGAVYIDFRGFGR